jgi:hypothetical protein
MKPAGGCVPEAALQNYPGDNQGESRRGAEAVRLSPPSETLARSAAAEE